MTWADFLTAVERYKAELSKRPEEDFAYLRCLRLLENRSTAQRAAKSRDIVRFLNDWKCGVNNANTPPMLAAWIRQNADELNSLAHLTIADPVVVDHIDEIASIYDSLWVAARLKIRTWGPAANAKTLHQLVPGLFVMWDKNIVPFANGYPDFTIEMHGLAARMVVESPWESAEELEAGVQELLR